MDGCDVVAMRAGQTPVIVELKVTVNLDLLLQASERLALTDRVYIAFPARAAPWRRHWRRIRTLCRRLGIGILTVGSRLDAVKLRLEPGPYHPRGSRYRRERLHGEFERREGDPNTGGSSRQPLVTAYRQDALRCAKCLAAGELRVAEVRSATGVSHAGRILQRNVYGWFERTGVGRYTLTSEGRAAIARYAAESSL